MAPLTSGVTWDTWGSKLENIFASVFSQIPNLQGGVTVNTNVNEPVTVPLATGIDKSFLDGWRDNMSYTVTIKPAHGSLSEYVGINGDELIYTPNDKYDGSDFFTYFMTLGGMKSSPSTIAIMVSRNRRGGGGGGHSSSSSNDNYDVEAGPGAGFKDPKQEVEVELTKLPRYSRNGNKSKKKINSNVF